jgi:anti-sigma regulatory factor (Ser/Thr protein kinase)
MDNQTRQLLLANDVDELNRLAAFVENICEEWNLPVVWQTSLNMALEEAVSNIIFYASDD